MSDLKSPASCGQSPDALPTAIDFLCDRFDAAWKAKQRPRIEEFLRQIADVYRKRLFEKLLVIELLWRDAGQEKFAAEEYIARFPGFAEEISAAFMDCNLRRSDLQRGPRGCEATAAFRVSTDAPLVSQNDAAGDGQDAAPLPHSIGRYQIERILGRGGFGLVYLAYDERLQRPVAIKVPHAHRIALPEFAAAYLTEARTVARLDHPNIVPVYDSGACEDFPCYVVSKYIDGTNLAARTQRSPPSLRETVELVATVAEALNYAHMQGIFHRDVKPGNILLDRAGRPYLADFGLALRDEDAEKRPAYVGTPAYMSPEQARGEGHRVDGRSDIFSLGVVLYEMIAGRRPFRGAGSELRDQITSVEVRPPRQIDSRIPKELDRICLKALQKRATDRYSAAQDLADDLRQFLAGASPEDSAVIGSRRAAAPEAAPSTHGQADTGPQTPSDHAALRIVPKGLRSFDADDADFFLELLPGARDRTGLPDSVRFWKNRIESRDAESGFSVGLIYGPSGCGKSSLVKAGLLPRLSADRTHRAPRDKHEAAVRIIYLEASAGDTETRLLRSLRRQLPGLPGDRGLVESLAAVRRGAQLEPGQKLLIVLDQFEQWLHARRNEEHTELVQALRHCDSQRVQCIVMVRDDFWMAATHFMQELEVKLVEGQNSAAVDLFPLRHAETVLAAFGRAFGDLPAEARDDSKEQKQFVSQAVAGLAQDGKVISVRLALFAEMLKGRPWTPAALKQAGGAEGVGAAFLEATFSAPAAPPRHRYHQKAARTVLKALLPEASEDIKGHSRPRAALQAASGYKDRARDFEDLLALLDAELRLITPVDPEGDNPDLRDLHYQLTHDYLVHSLRDWLTRKQKETRRGRAELLLADRAAVWNARPENRQLPSVFHWLWMLLLTDAKRRTAPQRKMLARAGRVHAIRAATLAVVLALLAWGGYELNGHSRAAALRDRVLDATTAEVPRIIQELPPYRRWLDPKLREALREAESSHNARRRLHASLSLLPRDASQVDYLSAQLLVAEPQDFAVLRDALAPHKEQLVPRFWAVVGVPLPGGNPPGKAGSPTAAATRLRAAAALAAYDAANEAQWKQCAASIAEILVHENPVFMAYWSDAFRPVRLSLLPPLADHFRDRADRHAAERSLATNLLVDYAADQPQALVGLLVDADEKQFPLVFAKLQDRPADAIPLLSAEIARKPRADAKDDAKEELAKRQANAAVALVRMDRPDQVWPLLRRSPDSPDPTVRSWLVHRLGPMGAAPNVIARRSFDEPDVTIRRALILSLGEFDEAQFPPAERKPLIDRLLTVYERDADSGLHAAAEWLLRTWGQQERMTAIDKRLRVAADADLPAELLRDIKPEAQVQHVRLKDVDARHLRGWWINSRGQTMVVIPDPGEFSMGSPPGETGRSIDEVQHRVSIGHTFALAAKAVTLAQYEQCDPSYRSTARVPGLVRRDDLPVVGVSWFMAARYCNWLSEKEGIDKGQWCYKIEHGETRLADHNLALAGYRLPTEAEMEFATRAGAGTTRYFGQGEGLLGSYAWYLQNSETLPWPVGLKKPNDAGLFDAHGNVWCWCQEAYQPYENAGLGALGRDREDGEHGLVVSGSSNRVLRGGSFGVRPSVVRSACRNFAESTSNNSDNGIRVARTLPPIPLASLPPAREARRK